MLSQKVQFKLYKRPHLNELFNGMIRCGQSHECDDKMWSNLKQETNKINALKIQI